MRDDSKSNAQQKKVKAKVRFDAADVAAMVSYLQRTVLGQRVVNIYDGDSNHSTYLLKLESKQVILVESGIRFHTTSAAQTQQQPTPFCSKLRKHLRGLRLEQVRQLGQQDRVVLFQFGLGNNKWVLILELYAKGNIILANGGT